MHTIIIMWTVLPILLLFEGIAANTETVTEGNAQFSIDMYRAISSEDSSNNIVYSPLSAHAVLSMLYQGAETSTKQELAHILYVAHPKDAAEGYASILHRLQGQPNIKISTVNKILVMVGTPLNKSFSALLENQFYSSIDPVDFSQNENVAANTNAWIEANTEGKVKNIFKATDFTPDTRLVLVNTLYFKGQWWAPFYLLSKKRKFYVNSNKVVHVPTMGVTQPFYFKISEVLNAKVLMLPFENENFNMVLILPNQKDGLSQLEAQVARSSWNNILGDMEVDRISVIVPKFKIEQSIDLLQVLHEMGVRTLFDPHTCDLSGIFQSKTPVYVNKAVQKVVIDFNENGLEAVAASGFKAEVRSGAFNNFIADHPFMFALVEINGKEKNILCVGRVTDPLETN